VFSAFGGDAGFVDAALPTDAGRALAGAGLAPGGHHQSAVLPGRWRPRGQDQCARWDGEGWKEQADIDSVRPAMNTIDADSGGPCLEGVGD
jgi:hypothetical protein